MTDSSKSLIGKFEAQRAALPKPLCTEDYHYDCALAWGINAIRQHEAAMKPPLMMGADGVPRELQREISEHKPFCYTTDDIPEMFKTGGGWFKCWTSKGGRYNTPLYLHPPKREAQPQEISETDCPDCLYKKMRKHCTNMGLDPDKYLNAPMRESVADNTLGQAIIENGFITIRVAIDSLQTVLDGSCDTLNLPRVKITDCLGFAKDVAGELNRESEDGTTAVHICFDKAFQSAIEQGSEYIDLTEIEGGQS